MIPTLLDWGRPGLEGVLLVGFVRPCTPEEQVAIEALRTAPFDHVDWLGPLMKAFDDDMEGGFRDRLGKGLDVRVQESLEAMAEVVPVCAAFGYSGRRGKLRPDPVFAAAWLDLWGRLPTRAPRGDGFIEVRPSLFDERGAQLAEVCSR